MQPVLSAEQAQIAQGALNQAAGSVALGAESRRDAVARVVKEMSDAGITGFVDKSGRRWSAEAYVNMDIRSTCGRIATEATFARNKDYGNDLIWWPVLACARPGCFPYQGKICSTSGRSGTVEDLDGNMVSFVSLSSTTYGEPAGIGGINCHHLPPNIFIPGFSKVRGEVPTEKENTEKYAARQAKKTAQREARYAKRDAKAAKATNDTKRAQEIEKKAPKEAPAIKREPEFTSELLNPSEIQPVNAVTSKTKKNALAYDFSTEGYQGRPIVAIQNGSEGYQALTGSHRIYAAREAGIEIPAHIATGNDSGIAKLAAAKSDEERLAIAERLYKSKQIDKETLDLLRIEDLSNTGKLPSQEAIAKAQKWEMARAERAAQKAAEEKAYREAEERRAEEAREAARNADTPMKRWEKRMAEKHGASFWGSLDSDDWKEFHKIEQDALG